MTRLQTWSLPLRSQDPVIVSSQSKNVDFIDSAEEEFEGILSIQWTWCQVKWQRDANTQAANFKRGSNYGADKCISIAAGDMVLLKEFCILSG